MRHSRNFFSIVRARAFVKELAAQGIEATITSFRDAFNQDVHSVRWDIYEED